MCKCVVNDIKLSKINILKKPVFYTNKNKIQKTSQM